MSLSLPWFPRRAPSPTRRTAAILGLALLAGLMLPAGAGARRGPNPDWSHWLDGASGYQRARELYEESRQPIFVYFYTEWCGFCRQFERELLRDQLVHDYLDSIVAVRINPESGPAEAELGRRYGVQGFPALFVHSGESKAVSRVERMVMVEGRPQIMSPARFVDVVKTAGAR